MPKEHFSVEGATSLEDIPEGGKIHVMGVCGVAMAQTAVQLTKLGYRVSGSDKRFYDPMGSLLRESAVELMEGYGADNISDDIDLVVIGNAIPYKFDETAEVEKRDLPYTFFPKLLADLLIREKHSIVVSGTHGKSTTTALIASLLHKMKYDPSYFVGGIAQDLPHSLYVGEGAHSVVEGDEYDSAFFAKVPKFAFYRPDTCIINAIEFDHADIYQDVSAIKDAFSSMVEAIPAGGRALCCIDFPHVVELVSKWKGSVACEILTFGEAEGADYHLVDRSVDGMSQTITVDGKASFQAYVPLGGVYNARNALVSLAVMNELGLPLETAVEALGSFQPVKRRQQLRFDRKGLAFIEDFAHHPTAVNLALKGIREAYPDRRLWAVFEPRSSTSRRKVFQQDYIEAFSSADEVLLREVEVNHTVDDDQELLRVEQLAADISESGVPAKSFPDGDAILQHLLEEVGHNDVIVVMSNGGFDGLPSKLEQACKELCGEE